MTNRRGWSEETGEIQRDRPWSSRVQPWLMGLILLTSASMLAVSLGLPQAIERLIPQRRGPSPPPPMAGIADAAFVDEFHGWVAINLADKDAAMGNSRSRSGAALMGTSDGGRTWRSLHQFERRILELRLFSPSAGLVSLEPTESAVQAAAGAPEVWATRDGGASFTRISITQPGLIVTWFATQDLGWALIREGPLTGPVPAAAGAAPPEARFSIWRTVTGGDQWRRTGGLPALPGTGDAAAAHQLLWVAHHLLWTGEVIFDSVTLSAPGRPQADARDASATRLFASGDGGASWQQVTLPKAVTGTGFDYLRAAAARAIRGRIYLVLLSDPEPRFAQALLTWSDDAGRDWAPAELMPPRSETAWSFEISDRGTIWVSHSDGSIDVRQAGADWVGTVPPYRYSGDHLAGIVPFGLQGAVVLASLVDAERPRPPLFFEPPGASPSSQPRSTGRGTELFLTLDAGRSWIDAGRGLRGV